MFFVGILLAGCTSPPDLEPARLQLNSEGWITFAEMDSFSFARPERVSYRFDRSDGSVAFATNLSTSAFDGPSDYSLSVHELSQTPEHCSPSLTGSWQMKEIQGIEGRTHWGKVDFFEKFGSGQGWIDYDGPRPICAGPGGAPFGYSFCSEKGEKKVVLCIRQMADNPELALKIFETFRWKE